MKKIKLLFFTLILLGLSFTFFSSNTIKANTLETSNQFSVIGAQVRTTGNPGIRFIGSIGTYNNSNVSKYGLVLAFGEAEASNTFHKDATINDKKVITVEVDSVNASGNFYITIYDIPEIFYNQKISVRAYVVEGEKTIYSSSVSTRSLADVVKAAYNNDDRSEFVIKTYESLQNSFYEIEYILNGGSITNAPTHIHSSVSQKLPIPTKAGYTFLGWKLYSNAKELSWEVNKPTEDLQVHAVWGNEGLYVGENLKYKTLQDALNVAINGDTIIVMPGTYEGATINKSVTIKGYNAITNLQIDNQALQSVFTSSLIIAANDVTINGVVITGAAKFTNKTDMNISNPTIINSVVTNSTVNDGNVNNTAPFHFTNSSSYTISNLSIINNRINNNSASRPMIAFLSQIDGLTITNNTFNGRRSNYNDGIKTDNSTSFGVKGNVTITGNYFENYQQYAVWFRSYGAGTYILENNAFYNIGSVAESHAAFNFITYTGTNAQDVNISIKYNKINTGYILFRLDNDFDITSNNTAININYNSLSNCNGTYLIKNASSAIANIENNYWGTSTLDASKLLGATTPSNIYTNANQVPAKGDVEDTSYTIAYNLNGGTWQFDPYTYDEIIADLVADLSAYYGKTLTATTIGDATYGSSILMPNFFFTHETYSAKWKWLAEYMIATKKSQGKDASTLESKDNSTWRFEVNSFTSKSVRNNWPSSSDYSLKSAHDQLDKAAEIKYVYTSGPSSYKEGIGTNLIDPIYEGRIFLYWKDQYSRIYTNTIPTNASGNLILTAVFEDAVKISNVDFTNLVESIENISTYQLEWTIGPSNATNKKISFSSSNNKVFTVDENGLITPVGTGTATLGIIVEGNRELSFTIELKVTEPNQFVFTYETNSYTTIGESIKINNYYLEGGNKITNLKWESKNPSTATVNNGIVTGISAGTATIRASLTSDSSKYVDFVVTVLPDKLSEIAQIIVDAHNSNIFTRYNLGIGAGTPAYYKDMIGSISNLLYNSELYIDTKYLEAGNATGDYFNNLLKTNGVEFVTVHYTAGFPASSDTDNNADYFTSGSGDVSIHYVTGNNGKYSNGTVSSMVYNTLSHDHGAWHAGDSDAINHSGAFKWNATGVAYDGCDLLNVKFSASNDFYFEINGKKTSVKLPDPWNYKERNTDHIYNSDGTISAQPDYSAWGSTFKNRTPESFFNDQGFPVTIINGEYYLGTTWWCYTQQYEGRICGSGGNRNSIGIEACVNEGSDIWLTYQKTAQLVAKLMEDFNLDISRVKGHHFFSAKNCPQPLLENDMEIWEEFIEQVRYENKLLKVNNNSRYSIEMIVLSSNECINSFGRLTNQPSKSSVITYKVLITDTQTNTQQEIVLSSIIEGTNLNK